MYSWPSFQAQRSKVYGLNWLMKKDFPHQSAQRNTYSAQNIAAPQRQPT